MSENRRDDELSENREMRLRYCRRIDCALAGTPTTLEACNACGRPTEERDEDKGKLSHERLQAIIDATDRDLLGSQPEAASAPQEGEAAAGGAEAAPAGEVAPEGPPAAPAAGLTRAEAREKLADLAVYLSGMPGPGPGLDSAAASIRACLQALQPRKYQLTAPEAADPERHWVRRNALSGETEEEFSRKRAEVYSHRLAELGRVLNNAGLPNDGVLVEALVDLAVTNAQAMGMQATEVIRMVCAQAEALHAYMERQIRRAIFAHEPAASDQPTAEQDAQRQAPPTPPGSGGVH